MIREALSRALQWVVVSVSGTTPVVLFIHKFPIITDRGFNFGWLQVSTSLLISAFLVVKTAAT